MSVDKATVVKIAHLARIKVPDEELDGLVGEMKIVLRPTKDRLGEYLTAELAGDYAGLIPLIFQGKIKMVAVTRIERVTRGL